MLNVLRSSRSPRHIRLEGGIAIGLGMVMSLLWMALQEQGASEKISALKIQKTAWQQQLLIPSVSTSQVEGLLFSIDQEKLRIAALEKHQTLRNDLAEVQALLFAKTYQGRSSPVKLQSLRWQEGNFEWEGVSLEPLVLQGLLQEVSHFPRWQTLPTVVQILNKPVSAGLPTQPYVAFKLEGRLESDVLPMPLPLPKPNPAPMPKPSPLLRKLP